MRSLGLRQNKVDYLISFAVFLQSFLIVLQEIMISILKMDPESTTIYRVIFSAIPMSIAIILSFKRKKVLFIVTYLLAFLVLAINLLVYPVNSEYLQLNSFRFLLPIVIPSALCLMTVKSIDIAERALYYVSWATFVLVVFYIISYFVGVFAIDEYSMSFSYGCLLPMVALYRRKRKLSFLASAFLFLAVLAVGSRGAALVFLAYVFIDIARSKVWYAFLLIAFLSMGYLLLDAFNGWLEIVGIHSRTLSLLFSGEIDQDSGRGFIYNMFFLLMDSHPYGLGLFGDRIYLGGSYCHNILLEMWINWGYIGIMIIWPLFLILLIRTYFRSEKVNRNRIICYTLILIGPLMASGSYLIDFKFGLYCGLLYLIIKDVNRVKNTFNEIPYIKTI